MVLLTMEREIPLRKEKMIKRPATTTTTTTITKEMILSDVKTASKEKLNVLLSTLFMLHVDGKDEIEAAIKARLAE
jgi:hypothetical protein